MWLLLLYLNNILGYPSKYWNYTSKKQFVRLPHSPSSPAKWITFLPFISEKFLLNIKDVDFDFRMVCILVLFPFLLIINVEFTNFGFLNFRYFIFKYSDIGLLWSQITIFIIEIILKLLLHKKYGWITLTEAGWAWKFQNFTFCHFWELKNHRMHKHSTSCHAFNFHRKLIFSYICS